MYMKIKEISSKYIDIAKRGACALISSIILMIPYTGKGETKVESSIGNEPKIVQEMSSEEEVSLEIDGEYLNIDLENMEEASEMIKRALELADGIQDVSCNTPFVLVSHWEKTENYDNSKNYANGNREYKRTVYRFVPNKNFNFEYFEEDLSKMIEFFRDDENSSEIFDVIETYEQVRTFTPEEEKNLNTSEDIFEIEGTNIRLKVKSKSDLDFAEKARIIRGCTFLLFYLIFVIGVIKNYKRLG